MQNSLNSMLPNCKRGWGGKQIFLFIHALKKSLFTQETIILDAGGKGGVREGKKENKKGGRDQ